MRLLQVTVLALHAVSVVEAATKVSWTLHKSCYRKVKDTDENGKKIPEDELFDKELADAMIKSVNDAKAWAKRAASKITLSTLPGIGQITGLPTKLAIAPLVGGLENYNTAAKEIRDRFNKIADMEGPVGSDGDKLGRFGQSRAWIDLGNSDKHFNDFIITCRPEIVTVPDPAGGPFDKPYDVVRKYHMFQPHTLEKFLEQENSEEIAGDWEKVPTPRTMAITQRDAPPTGGRKRIAESINFHPLWIKFQRSRNFGGWLEDDFTEVTKPDALEDFKSKGAAKKPPVDTRPMDGLLSKSLTANMLHEFFHLSYFGNMLDAPNAYGWMNNVKNNDRENPDLYAIIGAVIELMNRDGQKYSVSAEGEVSPMS
ncbi:hypothetical protein CGCTS75_v008272 [Colletotrichum tropicale]|nr:hypothetical protein CGCTS75_v008272 [Colletotrichum tropicale]